MSVLFENSMEEIMRHLNTAKIVLALAVSLTLTASAFAASSCPGGGTPTNCKAHCDLHNPPNCTEDCECAIKNVGGSASAAAKRVGSESTGVTKPNLPAGSASGSKHK
jgi:hypothetical protein